MTAVSSKAKSDFKASLGRLLARLLQKFGFVHEEGLNLAVGSGVEANPLHGVRNLKVAIIFMIHAPS